MPFEIIVTTFSKVLEPQYVPFKFTLKGRNSGVRIGNAATIALEPIKNPVSGATEEVRIQHKTGFIFQSADCVSAKECKASVSSELNFSYPHKSGFVTKVKYKN